MTRILQYDPQKRLTPEQALRHPFLIDVSSMFQDLEKPQLYQMTLNDLKLPQFQTEPLSLRNAKRKFRGLLQLSKTEEANETLRDESTDIDEEIEAERRTPKRVKPEQVPDSVIDIMGCDEEDTDDISQHSDTSHQDISIDSNDISIGTTETCIDDDEIVQPKETTE